MPVSKGLLLGVVVIVLVVVYSQVRGEKWKDVNIKYYDDKVSAGQEFNPTSQAGIERCEGRKARAYFKYMRESLNAEHPVVKAYLDGNIVISHKERSTGESVEVWRLSGSLDGNMIDVIPGESKIEGASHSVKGWTIEWWRHPTIPVKVIIITNPNGKSRTFRIEWSL
ncbi:MAG TPA: hypothetical protein ACFYD5_02260 [Candidatus Tripitaka sp. YC43]